MGTVTKPASISSGSETKTGRIRQSSRDPDVLTQEIVEDLEAALKQFREIANDLGDKQE
jgi:hypothetical protein